MQLFHLRFEEAFKPDWLTTEEALLPLVSVKPIECEKPYLFANGKPILGKSKGEIRLGFNLPASLNLILTEDYATFTRPFHFGLPYHLIPGALRFRIFKWLVRRRLEQASVTPFPRWHTDLSAHILHHIASKAGVSSPLIPINRRLFAVTVDADCPGYLGFAPVIRRALDIPIVWFLCGLKHDRKLLAELKGSGDELALHDLSHSRASAFLPAEEIRSRLRRARGFFEENEIMGFRSPAFLTTDSLFEVLGEYFLYDSSVPDTDICGLGALKRGCCSTTIFKRNSIIEIPPSLPPEDKLLALGFSPSRMIDLWLEKAETIWRVGGLPILVLHSLPHLYSHNLLRTIKEAANALSRSADPTLLKTLVKNLSSNAD